MMNRQINGRTPKAALLLAMTVCGASRLLGGDVMIERPAPTFGMVGIAQSETARLNAVLVQPAVQQSAACVVDMKFVDSAGRTLAIAQKVQLRPGVAQHLDLPGTRAYMWQPAAALRSQIRAEITPLEGVCTVAQTLELFDTATGKTSLVVNPN